MEEERAELAEGEDEEGTEGDKEKKTKAVGLGDSSTGGVAVVVKKEDEEKEETQKPKDGTANDETKPSSVR